MDRQLAAIFVFLCLLLAALCLARPCWGRRSPAPALGGAPSQAPGRQKARRTPDPAKSAHLVVDTFNLTHWLQIGGVELETIVATIDRTAPIFKLRHSGKVMYVLKDRETRFSTEAALEAYRLAAIRNKVYVAIASRYLDPPAGAKPSADHSSRGRDDFYMSLLALQHRCAVLTEDRLRDFDRFRSAVPPFYVIEFDYWRDLPHREVIRPDSPAYLNLPRPRLVRYSAYPELRSLGPLQGAQGRHKEQLRALGPFAGRPACE